MEQSINKLYLSHFVALYCQLWVIFYKDLINKDINRSKERNDWFLQYNLLFGGTYNKHNFITFSAVLVNVNMAFVAWLECNNIVKNKSSLTVHIEVT